MTLWRIAVFAMAAFVAPALAQAAGEMPASYSPRAGAVPARANPDAYRQYVKAQADLLVGMTKVLVTEVKDGNVDAALSAYAPAHRYLARLAPAVRLLHDLDLRLDAQADAFEKGERDPRFSGFHRIEHGLFANRSTTDLSDVAVRLDRDVRVLRAQLSRGDMASAALVGSSAQLVRDLADTRLDAGERYSRADLWDVEANVDGVDALLTALQPETRARTEVYFVDIRASLEKHKAGCGFKRYDELGAEDKATLKRQIAALAEALAPPRGLSSID